MKPIQIEKEEKDLLIEAPFIFGAFQSEFETILEIPYFSVLVNKKDVINT